MSGQLSMALATGSRIGWRLRRDLEWTQVDQDRVPSWVITDPLTRKHFRVGDEERFILLQLDGNCDAVDLQRRFRDRFAPKTLASETLVELIQLARRRQLLIGSESTSHGGAWQQASEFLERLVQMPNLILFGRISLFNPEPLLRHLQWLEACTMTRGAVQLWLVSFLVCCIAMLSRWTDFVEQLPSWQQLIAPRSLLGFGIAFLLTRLVHELGHAIACRFHNARCPDAGVFIMFGIVCPYVDVSDSSRLVSRWHRAAIASAGVYAELILATLAGCIWLTTYDGRVHSLAWKLLVVSSVSTILFNMNPLMRYDGYFVLSDLLGLVNLREKSVQWLQRRSARVLFGVRFSQRSRPALGGVGLGSYALASILYRLAMTVTISVAVWQVFVHFELTWLAMVVVGLLLVGAIFMPIVRLARWTKRSLQRGDLGPGRAILGWSLLAVLLGIILFLPVPQRVACRGMIVPADETTVYATAEGRIQSMLDHSVSSGTLLASSQPILSIANSQLDLDVLRAEAYRSELWNQIASKRRLAFSEPSVGDQLPKLEAALESARKQVDHARHRQSQSKLTVVRPGRFVSANAQPIRPVASLDRDIPNQPMVNWTESVNQGRIVPVGTVVGWVNHSDAWLVRAYIDETQLPSVLAGLPVAVRLGQDPYRVYYGKVQKIAVQPSMLANEATEKPSAVARRDASTTAQPAKLMSNYFVEASIELPKDAKIARGGQADLVIHSRSLPMAKLMQNWLLRNMKIR